MSVRRTILLPAAAFLQAWQWEIRKEPPTAFGGNNYWLDDEAKKRLEENTLDVLADLGLAAGGTLARDFRETLATLANGRRYSAFIGDIHNDRTGTALVSVFGAEAIRVLRAGELIRLDPIPAETAVEQLVDVLPEMPPARLNPIAVPKSRYRPDGPVRNEQYEFSMPTGQAPRDPAQRPRELMAAPRLGLHQLYAGESTPLTVVDVAEGRLLTFVSEAPREEPKINFLPGTRQNLAGTLRRL